jgi:hypothetical protein
VQAVKLTAWLEGKLRSALQRNMVFPACTDIHLPFLLDDAELGTPAVVPLSVPPAPGQQKADSDEMGKSGKGKDKSGKDKSGKERGADAEEETGGKAGGKGASGHRRTGSKGKVGRTASGVDNGDAASSGQQVRARPEAACLCFCSQSSHRPPLHKLDKRGTCLLAHGSEHHRSPALRGGIASHLVSLHSSDNCAERRLEAEDGAEAEEGAVQGRRGAAAAS